MKVLERLIFVLLLIVIPLLVFLFPKIVLALPVSAGSISSNLLNNQFAEVGNFYTISVFMQFPQKLNITSCQLIPQYPLNINFYKIGDISQTQTSINFNEQNFQDVKNSASTTLQFQVNFPVEGEYLLSFYPNCYYFDNYTVNQIDNRSMNNLGKFVSVLSSKDFSILETSYRAETIATNSNSIAYASFFVAIVSTTFLALEIYSNIKLKKHVQEIKNILNSINRKLGENKKRVK